ncbi:MAG: iron complex outermembrane receptor protein [Urechidicola sp.]|jgi:iron complex outermembrane receptor protein
MNKSILLSNKIRNLFALSLFVLLTGFCANATTVTGIVTGDGVALPGATVSVKGNTTLGTTTDMNGKFSLDVDLPAILIAKFVGFESQEIAVTEENKSNLNFILKSGTFIDEVIVLGTRSSNRTNLDSPVPVDVISISKLATTAPQTDLNQMLHFTTPSFSSNTQTISDGTDHIDPAALRGLGPDQVLVLINGKRRHNTSLVNVNGTFGRGSVGTDLNAIPATAIDKIEVLRDGAAAQYGSDAIAGVINLRLKEDVNKLGLNLTTGANFSSEIGPFEGETKSSDGEVVNLGANYGIPVSDKGGFINLTGELNFRGATSRMQEFSGAIFNEMNGVERLAAADGLDVTQLTIAQVQQYAAQVDYISQGDLDGLNDPGTTIDSIGNYLSDDATDAELAARGQERSDYNMRVGQSQIRGGKFFANLSIPLSENSEVYGFGGTSYRRGESGCFYRLPGQNRTTTSIYPNGTVPRINSNIIDRSFGGGITSMIGEWNTDFSVVSGFNSFLYNMTNTHNATLGTSSPTAFDAGGHTFNQTTSNFDLARGIDNVGSLKGINLAFGAEYRQENYVIIAGSEQSYGNYDVNGNLVTPTTGDPFLSTDLLGRARPAGAQCFAGFLPTNAVDANRSNIGTYFDIETDFSDAFLVAAALRFENYSDFGSTFNYKVSSRYKLSNNIAVRGAYSTGFRAPSLHQIHFSRTSTIFSLINGVSIPQEVGIFANTSRAAQLLGIPELKEEISQNMSIGFTAKIPNAKMKITVDAYQVNIQDRVILTGQFAPGDNVELQGLFDQAGATAAAFFANAIDTKSQGLDFVVSHRTSLGKGTLTNDFAGTFTKTIWDQDAGINASPLLEEAGLVGTYFDQTSRLYLEQAVPRVKVSLGNTLTLGKTTIYLRNTYFGETTEATGEAIFDEDLNLMDGATIDPYNAGKVLTDLSFGHEVSEGLSITVGANNLLDVYPDEADPAFQSSGRFVYSRRSPQFSFGGRHLFARLSLSIK